MMASPEHRSVLLRERADHCRCLASGALPTKVAIELEQLAEEYDSEATKMDALHLTRGGIRTFP